MQIFILPLATMMGYKQHYERSLIISYVNISLRYSLIEMCIVIQTINFTHFSIFHSNELTCLMNEEEDERKEFTKKHRKLLMKNVFLTNFSLISIYHANERITDMHLSIFFFFFNQPFFSSLLSTGRLIRCCCFFFLCASESN